MTYMDELNESQANTLCRSCGLCCTGHLFIWAKLRPAELDPAEVLGMRVFRADPTQRGFAQPCPLWQGECRVYASPRYPHVCRAYQCRLLKELLGQNTTLPDALAAVEQVKEMIQELETMLPASSMPSFRERLVARLETSTGQAGEDEEFRRKANILLKMYEDRFGVTDVVDQPEEE